MANLDFYALGDDLRRLFEFFFSETDVVAFELTSKPEKEPQQFTSLPQSELRGSEVNVDFSDNLPYVLKALAASALCSLKFLGTNTVRWRSGASGAR